MEKKPLIIKKLSIYRMPGFPKGLASYEKLSPYINIISGPNGSGKSSTARIIKKMIWPKKTQGIQSEGSFLLDGEHWHINIESQQTFTKRNGKEDKLSGLPAPETQNRYILSLHELVHHKDQDMAQHIIRESIGGYDPDKAKKELGYEGTIKPRSVKEFKEYENAKKNYNETLQQQKELRSEEEKLESLKKQKETAERASKLLELYGKVNEYRKAKKDADEKAAEYNAFPGVYENISGKEYKNIEELEEEINGFEKDLQKARHNLKDAKTGLSNIDLPENGIQETTLKELDKKTTKLSDINRDIKQQDQKLTEARTKASQALKAIDNSLNPDEWKGLNLNQISGVDQFLTEAHKAVSEDQYLQTRIDELSKEKDNNPARESEKLRDAIKALSYWLKEQKSRKGITGSGIWILTALGIATGLFSAIFGYIPLIVGGILLIALSFYSIHTARNTGKNELNLRREDFKDTGIDEPESWDSEKVTERMEQLIQEQEQAEWNKKIENQLENLQNDKEALRQKLEEINRRYDQWKDELKTLPDLQQHDLKSYSGLAWFLNNVQKWQEEDSIAESAREQQNNLIKEQEQLLEDINALFLNYRNEKAKDPDQARAIYENLAEDERQRQNYVKNIKQYQEKIEDLNAQKVKSENKLKTIYDNLQLPFGEKSRIKKMVDNLPGYKKVKQNYFTSQKTLEDKKTEMEEHSLYKKESENIVTLTDDELQDQINKEEETANKRDSLIKEINTIENKIGETRSGNALENSLNQYDRALEKLHDLYETNLSSITGDILIKHLKKENRETNRPAVFQQAGEIFSRITGGRYHLDVDQSENAEFKAIDTVLDYTQPLDELSTGTRIQLLISVRLAFIENQEEIVKLPVIADELLANSDEIRAKEIIDAMKEISKSRRQILYFTAQEDEVAKWKHFLNDDIQAEFIKLSGKPNASSTSTAKPAFSELSMRNTDIPEPQGLDHYAYGKKLNIPPFDILTENVEKLHLWYILKDSEILYNCLIKNINYWGQLDNFLKNNGQIEGLNPETITKLQEKTYVFGKFIELYRQGRPKPISRTILESSDAVSPKFIDEVSQKLEGVNGNPRELVKLLEDGDVSGFRQNKIEQLREYLTETGYIPNEQPLEHQDIIVRLQAQLSGMHLQSNEIERLWERVRGKLF